MTLANLTSHDVVLGVDVTVGGEAVAGDVAFGGGVRGGCMIGGVGVALVALVGKVAGGGGAGPGPSAVPMSSYVSLLETDSVLRLLRGGLICAPKVLLETSRVNAQLILQMATLVRLGARLRTARTAVKRHKQ